jgi:phage gpG-like protein
VSYVVKGMAELRAALKARADAFDAATRKGTADAAHLAETAMKRKLTTYSHPKGTPTTSPPGQPPALVTGQLRRSIRVEGPTRVGPSTYQARIGPTAVYGRIQELGGMAGRGHASYLPPRPYVSPVLAELTASGRLRDAYMAAWRAAMGA